MHRTNPRIGTIFVFTAALSLSLAQVSRAEEAEAAKAKPAAATPAAAAKEVGATADGKIAPVDAAKAAPLEAAKPDAAKKDVKKASEEKPAAVSESIPSSSTEDTGYGKTRGLLGPVTFGPTIGISLPQFANIGLEGRWLDIVGFAFNYGFLPETSIPGYDAKVKSRSWDIRLRVHPFRGAFFLGVAMGNQTLTGTRADSILGIPQTTSIDVSESTLTPHLGWRWFYKSGFVWGLDLGVQIPQTTKTTLTSTASALQQAAAQYAGLQNDLNKVSEDIGKQKLPMITMVHLGWMF